MSARSLLPSLFGLLLARLIQPAPSSIALRRGAPSPVANAAALSKVQAAFQPTLHDASQVAPGRKYRTLEHYRAEEHLFSLEYSHLANLA